MKRIVIRIISLALCLATVVNTSLYFVSADSEHKYGRYQEMNNLQILSISQGSTDAAIKSSAGHIYIPAGTYVITEPIVLNSGNLVGAGMDKTIIVADFEDPRQPIVLAGYKSSISNIQFRYKDGLVTGKEKRGERVGIFTGYTLTLQKGASIKNVKLSNVGTGFYAPGDVMSSDLALAEAGSEDDKTLSSVVYSAEFENIVVEDFSFVGIDFTTHSRTGNVLNNIYLSSGKYACESAVVFKGGESETTINLLTVADTRAVTPVVFEAANALDIGALALRNVSLINKKQTAYVYWNESSGRIGHFSANKMKVESRQSFFEIDSASLDRGGYDSMQRLSIGKFTLSAVTNMTYANDFTYFRRALDKTTPFYITVDEYYYDADRVEREVYRAFPTSDLNLIYTKKGQITTEGSTALRPTNRLCPYYTEYMDTTLGKTVVWTGEEWK